MNSIFYLFLAAIILILSVNRCKANTIPLAEPPAGKYIVPNIREFDEAGSFKSSQKLSVHITSTGMMYIAKGIL